jgi:hypothetical protein
MLQIYITLNGASSHGSHFDPYYGREKYQDRKISNRLKLTSRFNVEERLVDELTRISRKGELSDTDHVISFQLNNSTYVPLYTKKYRVTYYSCFYVQILLSKFLGKRSSER